MAGYIQIYCGDGKGKTTAAIGLSIRGAGAGIPVVFVQFMKNGTSSEIAVLEQLKKFYEIDILYEKESFGFSWTLTKEEKRRAREVYTRLFITATQKLEKWLKEKMVDSNRLKKNAPAAILVLDEIVSAYNNNMIDQELVLKWFQQRPESVEVVLTGREPKEELLSLAAYITEMKKQKHVYEKGVMARKGIEW